MTVSPPLLAQSPILLATRFSFLGHSGWKSEASRDAELLFAPERLAQRLALFRAVTLPSLAGQTDPGFHHLILTAASLPETTKAALEAACLAAYGDAARFTVLAARPAPARNPLRQFMSKRWPDQPVAQVVLDDDDGLAIDFIAELRRQLTQLDAERPDLTANLPYFLSWSDGYGLSLREDGGGAALYRHRYSYINAGLTMIGLPTGKNIFGIDHLAAPRRFGATLLTSPRMFLRSIHGFNDSRVTATGRWQRVADWQAEPGLIQRFPSLFAPNPLWSVPLPDAPAPDVQTDAQSGAQSDTQTGNKTGNKTGAD